METAIEYLCSMGFSAAQVTKYFSCSAGAFGSLLYFSGSFTFLDTDIGKEGPCFEWE